MMTDSDNPYRTQESDAAAASNAPQSKSVDRLTLVAWPIVFGVNLILPMILSQALIKDHGQAGMCLASLLMIMGGWMLCVVSPSTARKVIYGSVLVALTQVFPVLHIIAGSVSIGIAHGLHLLEVGNDPDLEEGFGQITSEFGGFVVTILVGGMLLTCAAVIGVVLSLALPQRWITPNRSRYSLD